MLPTGLLLVAMAVTPAPSHRPLTRPQTAARTPAPSLRPGALVGPVVARPDSLASRLRRDELAATRPRDAGAAALLLGRLDYARGEYRSAADAFARAAARLDPARKSEALYWAGLSWLGLHSPNAARAALEEVVASGSPRGDEAQLAIAVAWEQDDRPEKAYGVLERLLERSPGEATPAALERLAALADRFHRPAEAARARERLLSSYPTSMEAAMTAAALAGPTSAVPPGAPIGLEVGRFAGPARARALAARAARAGFPDARVLVRGEGAATSYTVLLGTYPDAAAARDAEAVAARELGLSPRLTGGP